MGGEPAAATGKGLNEHSVFGVCHLTASRDPQNYVIGGVTYSREEIITKYLHLVRYVAGRISINLPPNVEINDLINDGILGLIDAIEKYDDDRGVKFETYAITRINGAILDALRALDWVPRAVRQRARELERVYQELEVELGRAATEEEVAARLGVTLKEFDVMLQRIRGTTILSLEEFLPNEKGYEIPLVDTLRDPTDEIARALESREIHETLTGAVDSLPPQERTVISLYYFEGLTLKEIKGVLGVSESRVSQILAQAVIHLRTKLKQLQADLGFRDGDPNVKQKYVRRDPPQMPA
jgi:RNA polymerase sigma factor for flagellar operon FliA